MNACADEGDSSQSVTGGSWTRINSMCGCAVHYGKVLSSTLIYLEKVRTQFLSLRQ